jgi:hypothetical protein
MTSSLPDELLQVFERSVTAEFATIDGRGQPIVWPVTPYYHHGDGCIDVTTSLSNPKKAYDAARNPHVALLFSDPTGSGVADPPAVLVQGTAAVDDADLEANRERYHREAGAKFPAAQRMPVPAPLRRLLAWHFGRIYLHVRPERIYVWPHANLEKEPQLFDSHIEEVRSGHNEETEEPHAPLDGGLDRWHPRLDELGREYRSAVLTVVGPDGFPFAVRVPVRTDRAQRVVRIDADPVGAPLEAGLACLCAHAHAPDLSWRRNFQVRGDLVEQDAGWVLHPHRVVSGVELPPESVIDRCRRSARRLTRSRRAAKAELARRATARR